VCLLNVLLSFFLYHFSCAFFYYNFYYMVCKIYIYNC
jgi:hypothetical protein